MSENSTTAPDSPPITATDTKPADFVTERTAAGTKALEQGVASAKAAVGPLAEKATTFARQRPWATAALVGTVVLAVFNSIRGKRA